MVEYNTELMTELADAFFSLSEIRMGLLDTDANEFFAYPRDRSVFCDVVRANPRINSNCVKCDLEYMRKCRKTKSTLVYTCHLGLTEVIVPIVEDDIVICYFMFGQIIVDEFADQSWKLIYNNVLKEGFENEEIIKAIRNIKVVSTKKLNASVKILDTILSYIFSKKLINLTKSRFVSRINSYIESNLSSIIHVGDLSQHLNISRTSLYELSRAYLGCGIGDYITNRKIFHAKKMLENTNIKITDMVDEIGFSDYNYFSKVFKKRTGISPQKYRNQEKLIHK